MHRQTSDIHSFALTLVDKTKELDVEKRKTDILLYQVVYKCNTFIHPRHIGKKVCYNEDHGIQ